MPMYDYQCTNSECAEIHSKLVSISASEEYVKNTKCQKCGSSIEKIIAAAPAIVHSTGTIKASSDFQNILQKMKKNNPGSNMKV